MNRGPLRAGVAEIDMDPPLGLATGDAAPKTTGFLTPMYIRCLVLSNGQDEVAVVTLDLLAIDGPDADRAAELASQRCGVPADNIIMSCSHTHVGPSMEPTLHVYRQHFNPVFDEAAKQREREWIDRVVEMIADAVAQAKADLRPASLGVATAELPWLIYNRRRHTRNYRVRTEWCGIPKNQAYRPEGPIDPDLGLLVVRDANHQPLCLLWNFPGHNCFRFGDKYTADLAYTVQVAVEEAMGRHVPCLYTPGCSGNIEYYRMYPHSLERTTEALASAIMAIHREACTLPEVTLGGRKATLWFAERDTTRDWWKYDIHTKIEGWDQYYLKELARFQAEAKMRGAHPESIVVLRLGHSALVALPGEIFVEFGLMIKERSPFPHTYVAGYANGYAGYIATRRAFIGGGYEVWPTLNSRVGREGGYLMVDKAVELLHELHEQ